MHTDERIDFSRLLESTVEVQDSLAGGYSFTKITPKSVMERLDRLCRREQISSLVLFLTAFGILVHRYTRGEHDIVLRVSVVPKHALSLHFSQVSLKERMPSGIKKVILRPYEPYEHKDVAQLAPNDDVPKKCKDGEHAGLPLSGDKGKADTPWSRQIAIPLHDQLSLHQALQQVSRVVTEAFADVTLPSWLNGGAGGLSVNIEWREPGGEQNGLLSACLQSSSYLVAHFHYQHLLSLSKPVLRIASHWQTLLAHLDGNLNTPISRLPLLDLEEEHLVLREWCGNTHSREVARQECLHHFFEAQATSHPERIALSYAGWEISYGELDQQANRLARYLRAKGIGRGSFVAMMLPRSIDVYLSILAILKSGAAYVPIDPECPPSRVDYILQDCQVAALLTTSGLAETLSSPACPILPLDREWHAVSCELPEKPAATEVEPEDVAYVIYTSGSTGRPKGVQIEHRSVCNLVRAERAIFQVQPQDRVYQGFSIAFDASVEEIWLAFSAGAALVVGTQEMVHAGATLARILTEQGVSVLSCVPTLLSLLEEDIPTMRLLILGGEACAQDLVSRWWRQGRRVVNTYGPTEATVIATCADCHPYDKVTIGQPIANYAVYILDAHLQPVPIGVAGELHIGGVGLSRGYVNQPELTREKFIPNPYAGDPGAPAHLYKTGDLVRFTANGAIEFLGRIDAQVKLRGFRVELTEIESVLLQCPGVKGAVVALREDRQGLQQLAAYVIVPQGQAFNDAAARAFLRSRLPAYMVPSVFMALTEFPTLPSGKVDRKRLPVPQMPAEKAAQGSLKQLPRTSIEQKILTVWEQLFSPHQVSVQDNFFELGGHSLLAARMVSELRKDPQMRDVAMLDIYKHPTLESFARQVEAGTNTKPEDTADNPVTDSKADDWPTASVTPAPRRHSNLRVLDCGIAQLVALYGVVLLLSVPVAGLPEAIRALSLLWTLALLGAAAVVWLGAISLLLPVVAGRLLIGGVRPGSYPLWGATYLRWWLYRKILALSPLDLLAGSPQLAPYLRLLGAKVGRDCHLASAKVGLPMLIDIDDGVSIGYGVELQPFAVDSGWLRLAPIRVGRDSFLGTNSVVLAGAEIGSEASIAEQSLVHQDHIIPAGEHWGGSPIKRLEAVSSLLEAMAAKADGRGWPVLVRVGFIAGALLLRLLPWLMWAPSAVLVGEVTARAGLAWGMASTVLAGPLFVLVTCALVLISKRAVMPVVHPGIYLLRSGFGPRKWLTDQLMAISLGSTSTLYGTLYLAPFLRLLGARIGRWCEVSTVDHVDPDMLILGDESFVADIAIVGAAVFHRGCVALAPAVVGRRGFVGNGALVPGSSHLGDNSLIGVHSVLPARQVDPETSWLGSPAIFLPRRQASESFEDEVTYRPRPSVVAWRLAIEFFRVTLPATILALTTLVDETVTFNLAAALSPLALLALMPLLIIGIGVASTLVVVLLKWLIVGRYRPRVEPLGSMFVPCTELITGLYEAVAVPALVDWLTGTPWMTSVLRLFGARIGRRVWLGTTYLTEFDLVEVGDDAAVGEATSLQTHLFEDRVMKMSTVRIGAASSVGSRSVVLYDAEVGTGASLDALSLVMKGETLPARSHWRGIPAHAN